MKPERIQVTAPIKPTGQPSSGVFQILRFETAQKVKAFAQFVTHMAQNYGRGVTCHSDLGRNQLTVLAEDELSPDELSPDELSPGESSSDGASDAASESGCVQQPGGVREFLRKVVEAFHLWSPPSRES